MKKKRQRFYYRGEEWNPAKVRKLLDLHGRAMYALSAVVLPAKLYFLLKPESPEVVREITEGILKESLEYAVKTHEQIIRDDHE